MKKTIFLLLIFVSLVLILVRNLKEPISKYWNINQVAGLKVMSSVPADVYINSLKVGQTPYEDSNLAPTDYLIKLTTKDGSSYQGQVNLKVGTITVINREIGKDKADSSGEILALKKGSGVTVTSSPDQSEVMIDGKAYGKTPNKFEVGAGDHLFVLSHNNYLNRSIKASIPEGYELNLNVDLSLTEVDLSEGIETPAVTIVTVKNTPTGFLRMRDKPSLNGVELARLKVGEELTLIEETNATWDKVKSSDGKEGYVSAQYLTKKSGT